MSDQGMKKGSRAEVKKMGPLKVAALNGLTLSRLPLHDQGKDEPELASNDERVRPRPQPLDLSGSVVVEAGHHREC